MSGAYNKFAWFYDRLQAEVEYDKIAQLFDDFIKTYSEENEVVLDLACGTGSLSMEMARLGYDVIGVDLSQDMLNEALEKKYDEDLDIQFLCQDMTELDLYGAVDVTLCVLDSLNHLDNFEDLKRAVERVSTFTCDGGLFIFDVNTLYKHGEILGNNAFNFDLDGLFCAWQNELLEDYSVNIYLDFFEKQSDGKYERFSERFTERYFELSEIENELLKNQFEIIGKFDDFSTKKLDEKSQRALYVCKRLHR